MSQYHFNLEVPAKNFNVKVDTAAKYGYFEHHELGDECGGGLWFEQRGDKLAITDYDGTYALPSKVCQALHNAGFIIDDDFWPSGINPNTPIGEPDGDPTVHPR